jgi:spermidine/putrescine transport system permease protein
MISNMLAGASQSTLPVLILSVNRTGITPDINALTTIMVIVMLFGMIVMNILQRIHNKKEARILEESNRRIQAARLAAEEY